MHYTIKSKRGAILGMFEGATAQEAFITMMREWGYTEDQVWLEDNEICYYSADDMLLCGKPENYQIVPI